MPVPVPHMCSKEHFSSSFFAHRNEEIKRHMSEAGLMELVELRIVTYGKRFDNRSDKNELVWEHIHRDFKRLVEKGDLPPGDDRSLAALKKRYELEYGVLTPS